MRNVGKRLDDLLSPIFEQGDVEGFESAFMANLFDSIYLRVISRIGSQFYIQTYEHDCLATILYNSVRIDL